MSIATQGGSGTEEDSTQAQDEAPKINLRKLDYSPTKNPLVDPQVIQVKSKWTKTGRSDLLLDPKTGEIAQGSVISTLRHVDDAQFVKVFLAGVTAAFALNKTASAVFNLALREYEKMPLTGGYADHINLYPHAIEVDGEKQYMLNDESMGMSVKNFQRGLVFLLANKFLYPKQPHTYWVNPALFFKGDRVQFITEYRRKTTDSISSTSEGSPPVEE